MAMQATSTNRKAEKAKQQPQHAGGTWGMVGIMTLLLLTSIVLKVDYLEILKGIVFLFVQGPSSIVQVKSASLLELAGVISALLTIDFGLMVIVGVILGRILPKEGKRTIFEFYLQEALDKGPQKIFDVIFREELYSRGLLLWLLWDYLMGRPDAAFYVFFLLGNVAWAFLHYFNSDPQSRHVLRVLPQFVGGIVLTYTFVRWGFWAAVLVHWFFDVVLFAQYREQGLKPSDVGDFIYFILVGAVASLVLFIMGVPFNALAPWFVSTTITPIEGLNFVAYLLLFVVYLAVFRLLATILLLDKPQQNSSRKDDFDQAPVSLLFEYLLYFGVAGILIALGSWGLDWLNVDVVGKAVALATAAVFAEKTTSGSALARATMILLPVSIFIMLTYEAFGYWAALGIFFVKFIIEFAPRFVEVKGDPQPEE